MTVYQVLPLLQGLFSSVLLYLVVRHDHRSTLNRLFMVFLGGMALWGFSIGGMRLSADPWHALWWERASLTMIGLTGVAFYLFVRRYIGWRWSLGGNLAVAFLVGTLAIAPTGLLVTGMAQDAYGNAPVWGALFPIWVGVNYAIVITSVLYLERARRAAVTYEARNRYLYFIIGANLCLIGAATDAVSALGVGLYPMGILANIAFSTITAVAILQYRLLDIRVTLRKGAVYLVTSLLISVLLVSASAASVWMMLTRDVNFLWFIAPLVVVALVLEPLWRVAQSFLERRLYGERYDHFRALEKFSEQSRGITEMDRLSGLIVNLADRTLRPTHVSLLIAGANGEFGVTSSTAEGKALAVRLPPQHPLAEWLKNNPITVWHREMDIFPQLQAMSRQERGAVNDLGAELYTPVTAEGQMIGILALGPKPRKQLYTREDLQLLSTLSRQAALTLENVRLLKLERERAFNLEKLEQMKSTFMLAVSHQLKTPLTSVRVAADILGESEGSVSADLHRQLVGAIISGVDDLQIQISMILDFARMQSAALKLNCQPTDVNQVITHVAQMIGPQVRLKEQALEMDLPKEMPSVVIDRERFKQVVVCLLSNANKYTPKGGRISVQVQEQGDNFLVKVKDTGPGIPPREHEKIFEAFYQLRDEATKHIGGTGLGLAIAKGLVELHGGRIWVDSAPGQGSTFGLTLPTGTGPARDKGQPEFADVHAP